MTTPRLPDFLMLGQGKSGSSLIYRVLEANPLVGLPARKELHYFNENFSHGPAWYAEHFAEIPGSVARVGEISPAYLAREPLERLTAHLGRDLDLFFVLRRPIERLYARYLQNICATGKKGGFHVPARFLPELLDMQFDALTLAFDTFGADRILPLFFERDIAVPDAPFERKILAHLGLPPREYHPHLEAHRVNASVMPRFISTADEPLITFHEGKRYVIPKHRLIFCAQPRNTTVTRDPDPADVAQAFARQASWSGFVSEAEYTALQEAHVLPMADRLEARFGFDMSHWRIPPRRLIYAPAPPPAALQKDEPDAGK